MDALGVAFIAFAALLAAVGVWAIYWLIRTAIALWTGRWS